MQDTVPTENLPDEDVQPTYFHAVPEVHYPERLNAAYEMVDRQVEAGRGEEPAVIADEETLTYEELRQRVNGVANALLELGADAGDRVFVRFPNRPEYVVTCLAVQKIGAITVPSMKLLRANEISYVVENSGASYAVVYDDLLDELEIAREEHGLDGLEEIVVVEDNGIDHDHHSYDDLLAGASTDLAEPDTHRDDLVMIAYTSGTTGKPKGTVHTHRQMMAITDTYARYCLEPEPSDVFTSNAPIAFTFGYGMLVAFPLRFGATTRIIQDPTPKKLLDAIQEDEVSILASIPTAYNQMLAEHEDLIAEYDLSSLRRAVSAGEPLPPSTYQDVVDSLGVEPLDGIGSTEMLHIFISHRHDDEIDPTATGFPVPGYECKVVDPDTYEELDRGEPGILLVRGPTGVTYWNRPEKQRENSHDGWSIPGDIFVHREDGRFEYKSRRDDLIITGGYNVPGPEVEDTLLEREEVYQTAVIGVPDDERGQLVKAFVVPEEGVDPGAELTEALQDHVKERIAPYKYPRAIEYVTDLPTTETGKIQRAKLRERERE
ncbi:acyl-CoA synthetase [Natrononativus amylolyticus]|uniref:acyl-CoA synthetase n=1 Tax=Natrononativus amylolyticus TaxID=2963434 RepID=UPI0020CDA15F|nr:benzoate-CoA ligase family protein [Natrononativus amylolyticus]